MNPINSNHTGQQNGHYEEFQTLSLAEYMRILRRRWWIILIGLVVVLAPATFYLFKAKPVYQATTTIMVQEEGGMQQTLFDHGTSYTEMSTLYDQIHLLKSRYIAERVARALTNSEAADSLTILDGGFASAVGRLRGSLSVSPVKDTNYFVDISVRAGSPFEAAFLANTVAEVYQSQDQEFSRGEVREVVDFLQEQLQNKEKDLKESEELLKNYQERENIAFLSADAQEIVNNLAEFESMYNASLTDLETNEKRLEYLNNQLGMQKETLKGNIAQISSPLILKLRDELAEIERNAAVLIAQGVSEDYPDLKMLREKQKSIKQRLVDETQKLIISGLMPDDPLAHAQELVGKVIEIETEIHALRARSDALKRIVDKYNKKLETLPEKSLRYARLDRTKKVDEKLYLMMKEKYEESRISMAGQIGKVRIIDQAMEPNGPISPKTKRTLLLATLFGLGLGIGVIFLLEFMDKSVRNFEQIERLGFPLMGVIPHIVLERNNGFPFIPGTNGDPNASQYQLVTRFKPKSPVSESYRTLRTNLQFSESDKKIRSILITSAGPSEGKSTTVANLAITVAQMGFKTILVDADLRKPIQHRLFDLEKRHGISDLLFGLDMKQDAIHPSTVDNLHVLSCGTLPPNPSELLGAQRTKDFLQELKSRYQFVFLDSPPVIPVTDAQVLASEVDGVLLVVKAGKSQLEAVKRAHTLLRNVGANFMGVILNDMRPEQMYGNYYYHYYYHYYYGQDSKKKNEKSRRKKTGKRS